MKGFPEFKIKFVSELRDGYLDEKQEKIMMSERENVVTMVRKNHRNSETGGNGDTKGSFV